MVRICALEEILTANPHRSAEILGKHVLYIVLIVYIFALFDDTDCIAIAELR